MSANAQDFIPYQGLNYSKQESLKKAHAFYALMDQRRSIRHFSDQKVDRSIIEKIIQTASTAPSGANQQPWTFCAVSNPEIKTKIREAAEKEEYENYHGRMSERWLKDLKSIGTDHIKPFLEIAPWLIIVMKRSYEFVEDEKKNNYYPTESVGIATGFLLTAIHQAGLVALTHTPSPMNFLAQILDRPKNEKPYMLIPLGYPAKDAQVPNLKRKTLKEMAVFY